MPWRRRLREPDRLHRTFATTSNVVPGPHAEYPSRELEAATTHAEFYNNQREQLNDRLAGMGQTDELFVAKVFAMQRPDGVIYTYTTWTQGIRTLLPAADVVLLVEQPPTADAKPFMMWVRWDVTASICADDCWKMQPDLLRVVTVGWPSAEQFALLKRKCLKTANGGT
jgi:hypothetical protein